MGARRGAARVMKTTGDESAGFVLVWVTIKNCRVVNFPFLKLRKLFELNISTLHRDPLAAKTKSSFVKRIENFNNNEYRYFASLLPYNKNKKYFASAVNIMDDKFGAKFQR